MCVSPRDLGNSTETSLIGMVETSANSLMLVYEIADPGFGLATRRKLESCDLNI
jgi:hypothetical protein